MSQNWWPSSLLSCRRLARRTSGSRLALVCQPSYRRESWCWPERHHLCGIKTHPNTTMTPRSESLWSGSKGMSWRKMPSKTFSEMCRSALNSSAEARTLNHTQMSRFMAHTFIVITGSISALCLLCLTLTLLLNSAYVLKPHAQALYGSG